MNVKHLSATATLLLASAIFALPSLAQPTAVSLTYGADYGIGLARSPNNNLLISVVASLECRAGPAFLSLRGTTSAMVLADSFTDAGLLAGFVVGDGSAGSVAFSVGPALTTIEGTRPNRFLGMGDEEGVKRFTKSLRGLALGARLNLRVVKPARLSIYVFGNVNREENFGGVALSGGLVL